MSDLPLPVPGEATVDGLKLAFTPVSNPETDRATDELKPPNALVVSFRVPLAADWIVGRDGAGIVLGERQRMPVAAQCNALFIVNKGGNAIFRRYVERIWRVTAWASAEMARGRNDRKIVRVERTPPVLYLEPPEPNSTLMCHRRGGGTREGSALRSWVTRVTSSQAVLRNGKCG